jgi:hypothetical protein
MTSAVQDRRLGLGAVGVVLWFLTAALLLALWESMRFVLLAGLDVIRHFNPGCQLVSMTEMSEVGLRHWGSHVCAAVLVALICSASVFYGRRRRISRTTVIVLFIAAILGINCILLGGALSSMVPKIVQVGP